MKNSFETYCEEVIEALCEIEGCSEEEAISLAEVKRVDIEYGHKNRLTPSIIAGSLLGINGCCIPGYDLSRQ